MTSAPLRVTFVVPDLRAGGAERHVVTLVQRLDPQRFRSRVICLGEEGELFADAAEQVPTTSFGLSKRQAVRALLRLARELRRTRTDVVVMTGYNAETLGRLAAVLGRVPRSVVWVHNCDDLEPRGIVRRFSDAVLEPATDAYFGVAHAQRRYIVEELGRPASKVRIIHNGVEPTRFSAAVSEEQQSERLRTRADLGLEPDHVVIGILAAIRPEKDHLLLLEAARRVVDVTPRARFLVVGDGEQRPRLEARAQQLGLGEHVVFAGYRSDVGPVLRAIDVFTLTSFTVECFPMALLEAMASERPAVCTSVGGVPEMIEDGVTGFLVPPREVEPLAARLVDLVRQPELRRSMGRAARARVEQHFTLERSVAEAERRLTELVAGTPRGAVPTTAPPTTPIALSVIMDLTAIGGVELVTLQMFEAFDRSVVRPHLVVQRTDGPLADDFRAAGVQVDVLHRTGRFDLRTVPRLVRALRANGTEAVLVAHHNRAALVLGRIAARLAGVRTTLIAAHDMDLEPLGGRVLPPSTVATLRFASALVLLAPSQADYLHRSEGVGRRPWSRTREVVVPNGIAMPPLPDAAARDRAREALGIAPDDFALAIVARLSPQKAHHVLFQAFATFCSAQPNGRLVVVGDGERDAELRRLAVHLGISDRVLFTGVRRDVAALLPAFDLTCLSSVHEAAPIAVIESMAAGVPVVATACGALPDMIDDWQEGVLIPVGDAARFAEVLEVLATDPDLRTRMGAAARRRAERDFDIQGTARRYASLLRELVGR